MGCCESTEQDEEEQYFIPPERGQAPVTVRPHVKDVAELLAETETIDETRSRNIVDLFEKQNTIPFICRYRRNFIGADITPDKLRSIKNTYTEIVELRQKAEAVLQEFDQIINLNDDVRAQILSAKTVKELEFLQAAVRKHLLDKRDDQVQEYYAHAFLLQNGHRPPIQLENILNYRDPRFDTFAKVKDVLCNIISNEFSKDDDVLNELNRLRKVSKITLQCSKTEINNTANTSSAEGSPNDQSKYEQYFKFEKDIRHIKPHQILAINRGERLKFLSVTVCISTDLRNSIMRYMHTQFMCSGIHYALRDEMFERGFNECYTEKLLPLVATEVRAQLNEAGTKAALAGFAKNLKQLLLMPPLKGERILGIDPGFTNGCKLALISETADVLEVGVVYPHANESDAEKYGIQLANMLTKHRCTRIALGNGTGCRETEAWLAALFVKRILDRESIHYDIVSEQGASIYSCSDVARREFPKLDVNLISAVSIARRLNDPLSEYVKIEPRHLGVGMYQHDISGKLLSKCLYDVVSECVSYVGVDINTASLSLLKHVAGLNEKRAQRIIQYRQRRGPFRTRADLLKVNYIGKETFQQCSGFIRIDPKSIGGKLDNILDCTWVHPESYALATRIIVQCKLDLKDIGKPKFISKIKSFAEANLVENLSSYFGTTHSEVNAVLESLQRQLNQDYRSDKIDGGLLFKKDITQMEDLFIGEIVTGEVRNIVDFGAFVDIGIKCVALIHKTKMNRIKLKLGDRVTASVLEIDIPQKQVKLRLDGVI